ncbi:type II secretion system F family protein [bacterium]|nr:type II secretion system F family protein [bacterium]
MPEYSYKVKTVSGSVRDGVMFANEQRMVVDRLRGQKLIVLQVQEIKKTALKDILDKINIFKPSVKSKDMVLFSRQLSTLVGAGIPIVQGLTILGDQMENPAFKTVIGTVREDIESGLSITEALARHPNAFTELYVNMVKAGETGGVLDVILERLSNYLEASEQLKRKIKGAMIYPGVISFVCGLVTVFLLTVVIPAFKEIFTSFGGDLPLPTQLLIGLSEFVKKYVLVFIGAGIGFFFGIRQYYSTKAGQWNIDTILLKVPAFGNLLRKVAIAKFSRTLGTLVKSGVPILQALDTVAKTSGNVVIEKVILDTRDSIREGERIAPPLKKSNTFPPMVVQMIAVGEETGNLDTMLSKIADFYDQEVDAAVEGLTALVEPVIIVIMGLVVGAIVIAMFLPMFELGQLAGNVG